jgi:hypothetical protein
MSIVETTATASDATAPAESAIPSPDSFCPPGQYASHGPAGRDRDAGQHGGGDFQGYAAPTDGGAQLLPHGQPDPSEPGGHQPRRATEVVALISTAPT